ncbi:hypothetical protein CN918_27605 [Priestia megaterium]|nr:hypothetical protein CN918_27605 [Priestia megaterium]
MQINNNRIQPKWQTEIKDIKKETTNESALVNKEVEKLDTVSVSKDAIDIHHFMDKLSQDENGIRYEKVDAIERQINEGTYQVTAEDVVSKLLEGIKYGSRPD